MMANRLRNIKFSKGQVVILRYSEGSRLSNPDPSEYLRMTKSMNDLLLLVLLVVFVFFLFAFAFVFFAFFVHLLRDGLAVAVNDDLPVLAVHHDVGFVDGFAV